MQTRPFASALMLTAAGLLSACGNAAGTSGGSTGSSTGAAPATTTVTVTATAIPAPTLPGLTDPVPPDPALLTTASPSSAAMVPADPQGYGQAFVTAWVDRDRARAAVLGSPAAVSAAFGSTAPTPTTAPVFKDCGGAAGSTYCTWHGTTYTMVVQVGNERVTEH